MPNNSVAERYAQALVEIAQEVDKVDLFGSELARFSALLAGSDLLGALSHPSFSFEERGAVLAEVLGLLKLEPTVANFVRVVMDKSRIAVLPTMSERYSVLADRLAGRLRADVTTAVPLDAGTAAQIKAALEQATGKTILIDATVDSDILGGVVAKVEGRVYDASLKTRLQNLRQTLLATTPEQAPTA